MNRKERVDLNRARRRVAWLFLFLIGSLYWVKVLYDDIDSDKIDRSFLQISINDKDSAIIILSKKVDSLKLELTKPIEFVLPPKPKWIKKDTTHVFDSLKIKINPDTIELKPDTLKKPSN
jgi:hypothetical protein